jgi:penicillin-binding protein 2
VPKKRNFKIVGFSDGITYEKVGRKRFAGFDGPVGKGSKTRELRFFKFLLVIIVGAFVLRIFFLTVVQGVKNRTLSEGNRIRLVPIEALRGKIYDRNGQLLTSSKREYFLIKDSHESKITDAQVKELERQGLASLNFEGELGKVDVRVVRNFAEGEMTAHVIGYVSKADPADLRANSQVTNLDSVGRLGVEATYDNFLRGRNGRDLVEVDAIGHKVAILGEDPSVSGGDLKLTVDKNLQQVVYNALKKQADIVGSHRGAAIVQNPNTGEILALVSYPGFNPVNIGASITNRDKPYLDRAIAGIYPPGSVFKLVSALAGLESGKITKDTQIEDVGEFYLGDIRFPNWYFLNYGAKDGVLKVDRAIARSNDIFFYRAAEMTGVENIKKMAVKLGFGQKTGIDLPAEQFGLVPDGVWKESTLKEPWYPGDTMHLGIGQGFMLVTPIQISQMVSFMASGKFMRPYVVADIKTGNGVVNIGPKAVGEDLVKPEYLQLVRSGMKMACKTGGTGWPFFEAKYAVGCKTGTAEQAEGNPNAWFTAYAPFDKPQVAVTVVIEDGGEGSSIAGPVAKEILDYWFFHNK